MTMGGKKVIVSTRQKIFVLAFVFLCLNLEADEIVQRICFSKEELSFKKVENYDVVMLEGCGITDAVGEPQLPICLLHIAIPEGSTVKSVEVKSFKTEALEGDYRLYPSQPPQILSAKTKFPFINPNKSIYKSNSEYPEKLVEIGGSGYLGGYELVELLLYPLHYIPKQKKLILYTEIEFALSFDTKFSPKKREHKVYENLVKRMVLNPEDVEVKTYTKLDGGYEYVIITNDALEDSFQVLADWKTQKGIPTVVRTTSWIYSNFTGRDNPEKIRNFLKTAYTDSGLVWVLLGGDVDVVPDRIGFAMDCEYGIPGENDLRADLYYSDLDGTWDENGNGVFGEVEDNVDLYPDIFVGRAPVNSVSDVNTFVNKVITYEKNPPADYCLKMLFCAEILWWNPYTDAGIGKNMIDDESVPPRFDPIRKLYESLENENRGTVLAAMESGYHFINHDGHGWINLIGVGDGSINKGDIYALSNAPKNSIMYSIGCWTNAFHYWYDCFGEYFVLNPTGGGVAYIGNTSYGWGSPGNPGYGYSDIFDAKFFHTLFCEGPTQIGKVLAESKAYFIGRSREANVYRWHQYQLNLLGDPAMQIWTDEPETLNVAYSESLCVGTSLFRVAVCNGYTPVEGALACVMKDTVVYEYDYTDSKGEVNFTISPVSPGTLFVTVTAHNFIPYEGTAFVLSDGAYVTYSNHIIDDGGDEIVNPGETIAIAVLAKNFGTDTAYSVTGILKTTDPYTTITDSTGYFGDIAPGDTVWSVDSFEFTVDAACTNGHTIQFSLEIKDTDKNFGLNRVNIVVGTPILRYHNYVVDDYDGDGDHIPDPGENIYLLVIVKNEGISRAESVTGIISVSDSYITISDSSTNYGDILSGMCEVGLYSLSIDPSCPSPHFDTLTIMLTTDGDTFTQNFLLTIGQSTNVFFDDIERGEGGWTHGGTGNLWHITSHGYHSSSHSWYCGNDNIWEYDNNMNLWLTTPQFIVGENPYLSFWYWFDATTYGVDGIYIETGRDTIWETLDFIGSGGALDSILFGNDWVEGSYALTSYPLGCTLQVRFRFVSDATDVAEGFYIDDVRIGWPFKKGDLHNLSVIINDSLGNNNGKIDPGESVDMIVSLINDGVQSTGEVYGILRTDAIRINILSDSSYWGEIDGRTICNNATNPFSLKADSYIPEDYTARITLELYDSGAYSTTAEFNMEAEPGISIEAKFFESISFRLFQNYPNPFSEATVIGCRLSVVDSQYSTNAEHQHAVLKIYDVSGRLVRTLPITDYRSPITKVVWNGKDETGKEVSSGVYFYQLQTENYTETKKMILLR